MKIIITSAICLVALLLSSLMVLSGLIDITGFSFKFWFFVSVLIAYGGYKWKFKNQKNFRWFLLKKYVSINSFFKIIDNRVVQYSDDNKVTPMQEKAVKLWKLCLRDKGTNISCSISNRTRQIEKNNMLIILSPLNQIDYLMTILDIDNNKNCIYEIRIGSDLSEGVISAFDNENEKRMKEGEEERRNSIYSDLDKLLSQEEEALKPLNRVKIKNPQ